MRLVGPGPFHAGGPHGRGKAELCPVNLTQVRVGAKGKTGHSRSWEQQIEGWALGVSLWVGGEGTDMPV